jgi:HB1, ASXL, restriction endonuclease HTH domain
LPQIPQIVAKFALMSENLLSRLEQSLRQSRAARMHLAARLRELEAEADSVRAELAEMDTLASQTEAAIYRLLSSVLAQGNISLGLPSDAELEAAMRQSPPPDRRPQIPTVRNNVEVLSDRFMDRTIPQAVTLLLREEGAPLHVNEIYNRLLEGGFKFTGQNPTISVAVSLNRNSRFRKVAPGTFDLVMRDASKAS